MKSRFAAAVLAVLAALTLIACGANDLPPDPGTPEPAALDGRYESEYGTFVFNGDGRSVALEISQRLAEKTGLPAGESAGVYVFLFRNEEWRRDRAETFRLTVGGKDHSFPNAVGQTGEDCVSVYLIDGEDAVVFKKIK